MNTASRIVWSLPVHRLRRLGLGLFSTQASGEHAEGGPERVWDGGTEDRGRKSARTLSVLRTTSAGTVLPALGCWIPWNIPWAPGDKSLSPSLDLDN